MPAVVAPRTRVTASASFSQREIKLLAWLVRAILRGSRDMDIQRTVVRKPEWASLCSKIQRMDRTSFFPERMGNGVSEGNDG